MKKYNCGIYFECKTTDKAVNLLTLACGALGFEPARMDVYFDEFTRNNPEDVPYDGERLIEVMRKITPGYIRIKNMIFEVEHKARYQTLIFNLDLNEYFDIQGCSLTWANSNLDFLLNNEVFQILLGFEGFKYCYCCDESDVFSQDQAASAYSMAQKKRVFGACDLDDLDILNNWGRSLNEYGMVFMAAPLMWFGEPFWKIISKEKLLKFPHATAVKRGSNDLVHIRLSDIYDAPQKIEYRSRQKEYWRFFGLKTVIRQYRQQNMKADITEFLKTRAQSAKSRKKKFKL